MPTETWACHPDPVPNPVRLVLYNPPTMFTPKLTKPDLTRRIPTYPFGDEKDRHIVKYDEYVKTGGYEGLRKALSMAPDDVTNVVKESQLRGRGGAGFPTGLKWTFLPKVEDINNPGPRYLAINADESEPGTFKDRLLMDFDPHLMLEGIAICCYACRLSKAYIYIRGEYHHQAHVVENAIKEAYENGVFGGNGLLNGSDTATGAPWKVECHLHRGAGAYICGEETALLESIEGKRGWPRNKPPFPAIEGLFGKPTIINNVETLANIPRIVARGSAYFSAMGTDSSKGTKVFALSGKVRMTGLVEVTMGTKIRDIVFDIGGGPDEGRTFKAVQIGGPSGGCIPEEHLDIEIDYESLKSVGAMMGSGGLVAMDDKTCMVDVAKFFMDFIQRESCGKCIPCREGTRRMLEILERICRGPQNEKGVEALERFRGVMNLEKLAEVIQDTSLCGLGQTAPNPVLATLRWFRDEYEAHVYERNCPAGVCTELLHYSIDVEKCNGCTLCAKKCPSEAILGAKKSPHYVVPDKCIRCGACVDACRFGAVTAA